MVLEIFDGQGCMPEGGAALIEEVARCCLDEEGVISACASLTLVNGDEIRALNARTRGVDSETDVLSFPQIRWKRGKTAGEQPGLLLRAYDPAYGAPFLGDIVLNIGKAREQAAECGHSLRRELGYLTAHAMLHLLGYDHIDEDDKRAMRIMEKRTMRKLKLYRNSEAAKDAENAEEH